MRSKEKLKNIQNVITQFISLSRLAFCFGFNGEFDLGIHCDVGILHHNFLRLSFVKTFLCKTMTIYLLIEEAHVSHLSSALLINKNAKSSMTDVGI
jgi:hypothetical protein